jgi:hypothetical protein
MDNWFDGYLHREDWVNGPVDVSDVGRKPAPGITLSPQTLLFY